MKRTQDWVVNGYSERWLRKGFPWVYAKEIVRGRRIAGGQVRVLSERGDVLARGIMDDGPLAARIYRTDDGPLDAPWFSSVLDRAVSLRETLTGDQTTGYRLIHGENDGLPGLRVDVWGHYLMVVLESAAVRPLFEMALPVLMERCAPRGVYLCMRKGHSMEGYSGAAELVAGHPPPGLVRVFERGLAMDVDMAAGPDVGLYTDMRDLRAWLEPFWGGSRVLNTFSFTGAFSVAAALGGASEIVSVDCSAPIIARSEHNFRANGLDPAGHDFLVQDVSKALDRFRRTGRRFDRVVIDPPSFSRSDGEIFSMKKGYPRLVAAACRVLDDGGWLVLASNHGGTSPHQFQGYCAEGMRKAGCFGQLLYAGTQSADCPAATTFPEGQYLKTRVYRVLKEQA